VSIKIYYLSTKDSAGGVIGIPGRYCKLEKAGRGENVKLLLPIRVLKDPTSGGLSKENFKRYVSKVVVFNMNDFCHVCDLEHSDVLMEIGGNTLDIEAAYVALAKEFYKVDQLEKALENLQATTK